MNAAVEVYSLLVPLTEGRLLLPRSCVAEVVGYQAPTPTEGAPSWYLGLINWNGRTIPLVSFEAACGLRVPPVTNKSRVVITLALSGRLESGYLGVVCQGFPQLVRVSEAVIQPDHTRVYAERLPIICQVKMQNETPVIPDLEMLETLVAQESIAVSVVHRSS